jgi:predicted PurR-regulated permease PerM
MERPLSISITAGTVITTVLLLVGAWLLYYLKDLVLVVLTAIVIASAIEPAVVALMRFHLPRLVAVLALYVALFGFFLGMFYFFLPSILEDFATFVASLPSYLDAFSRTGAFDTYARILGLPAAPQISVDSFNGGLQSVLGIFGNAFTAASSVFGGFLSFLLILVFSFYFAVAETGVDDFLRVVSPAKYQDYVLNLWRRSQHKIGLWMQGQLLLAVIIGVLVYLSLTILGVKHALLLAVIAAVFELIPVFGPVLAAVPAVLVAFVDGGVTLGILVVALYIILQQFENHLIYPLVVTKVVGVPPLLVILALIAGAKLAGFLGVLLSVPAAAVMQELVKDYQARKAFMRSSAES